MVCIFIKKPPELLLSNPYSFERPGLCCCFFIVNFSPWNARGRPREWHQPLTQRHQILTDLKPMVRKGKTSMHRLKFHSLQTRLLTAVFVSMLICFAAFSWYNWVAIERRFERLEKQEVKREVERLLATTVDQIRSYEVMIRDWAHWDDSVRFVTDRNEEFRQANLYPEVINPMAIDSIRYYNLKSELVYAVDRDADEKKVKLSAALDGMIKTYDILKTVPNGKAVSHLLRHSHWIVIATVHPIRPNSGEGPHSGYIVFAKAISKDFETKMSQLSQAELDLKLLTHESYDPDTFKLPYDHARALPPDLFPLSPEAVKHGHDYRIWEVDDARFHVNLGLRDANAEVVAVLSFIIKRSLRTEGSLIIKQLSSAVAVSFLILSALVLFVLQHYFLKRLTTLDHQLHNLLESDLKGLRVASQGHDEIAHLAHSINDLLGNIEEKTQNINDIVATVKSGFLIADRKGMIRKGVSAYCYHIFGPIVMEGQPLSRILFSGKRDQDHFTGLYEQLIENDIDPEFSLSQLPSEIQIGQKFIRMTGQPIVNGGSIEAVVFTVHDITHLMEVEEENRRNRSLIKIYSIQKAFSAFLQNSRELIRECHEQVYTNPARMRKNLHTLKGNFSVYGMVKAADLIHEIEEKSVLETGDIAAIEMEISNFLRDIQSTLNIDLEDAAQKQLTVDREKIVAFLHASQSWNDLAAARKKTESFVQNLISVSVYELMKPVFEDGQRMAQQLGKKIEFELEGGEIMVDPHDVQRLFQDLIHIIRNALDHGIERFQERRDKRPTGKIRLAFSIQDDDLHVCVEDDGRGIDHDKIRKRAVETQILSAEAASLATEDELVQLLFREGFSTSESPTAISGRGIGMAAIFDTIKKRQGTITIKSAKGRYTAVSMTIPLGHQSLRDAGLRAAS